MTATTAENGVPNPPEASASPAPVDDAVDVEALKAAAAELAEIKAKMADQKKADRDARKAAQEAAEKAGEHLKALEAAKARIAELEGAEPLAAKWRAYEADEVKRLDGEAAALPDAAKALYAGAADLDGKRKVLDAFKALQPASGAPAAKPPGPAMNMGAPPGSHEIDFAAAYKDGAAWAEAKRRDPKGAAAFLATAGKPPSLLSNLTGGLFGARSAS